MPPAWGEIRTSPTVFQLHLHLGSIACSGSYKALAHPTCTNVETACHAFNSQSSWCSCCQPTADHRAPNQQGQESVAWQPPFTIAPRIQEICRKWFQNPNNRAGLCVPESSLTSQKSQTYRRAVGPENGQFWPTVSAIYKSLGHTVHHSGIF